MKRFPRWTALMAALVMSGSTMTCSRQGTPIAGDTVSAVNVAATPRADSIAQRVATMTVYKSPACNCCKAWVDHVRENGFQVVAIDTNDLSAIKTRYGVATEHAACHTAIVNGYVIEGHVPAADIRRLLTERPSITGLAVPGMPVGSPGMEGLYKQRYDVLAFTRGRATTVFATH